MARGDLYLESPAKSKLYLAQTIVASTMPASNWENWGGRSLPHGGIQSISRSMTKNPIIIPIPDSEPIGVDINMIEADTFRISTIWFDGIANGSTYASAETMFMKSDWAIADRSKPYRFQMGEREYYVMLNSWTADLTGGWGDTIPVTISLSIVQAPATW